MKKTLGTAFLIVNSMIGAGFASGKELATFFDSSGKISILMPLLIGVAVFGLSYMYLTLGAIMARQNINKPMDINTYLLKRFGTVGDIFMLINSFVLLSVMVAAIDSVGYGYGIVVPPLGVVCILLAAFVVGGGINRVMAISSVVVPILLVLLIITYCFGITSLSHIATTTHANTVYEVLIYVSLNMYLALSSITKQRTLNRRQVLGSSLIASVIIAIFVGIIIFAIGSDKGILDSDLPLIALVARFGRATRLIASIMLVLCAMTTLVIAFFNIFEWARDITSSKFAIFVVIIVTAIVLSRLGFETMLVVVYPILSVVCAIYALIATISVVRYKVSKRVNKRRHTIPNIAMRDNMV